VHGLNLFNLSVHLLIKEFEKGDSGFFLLFYFLDFRMQEKLICLVCYVYNMDICILAICNTEIHKQLKRLFL